MILRSAYSSFLLLAVVLLRFPGAASQQSPAPDRNTAPALLLSDIHFDPFHDPALALRLAAAPVNDWETILAAPPSADQQNSFAALQRQCQARGVDTPYALLHSSLQAMREKAPKAAFITVSGDLIAHGFDCRYQALLPGKSPQDYQAFVAKTVQYLAGRIRETFPGIPVYIALGNNDSGCGDYHMSPHSDFLAATETAIVAALPESSEFSESSDSAKAEADYKAGGYYSVRMAAPMRDTRLIVINDQFFSKKYASCEGTPDKAAADAQLAWLEAQLTAARAAHEKVWVMAHIPPGVDLYTTFVHFTNVCGGALPSMFLSSEKMADLLVANAGIIPLVLMGHTHSDELRLLQAEGDGKTAAAKSVAVKMVPSISPVNGNNPAFTVAGIDPATATLVDYHVYAASNQTGIGTLWPQEYTYSEAYHQPAFTPSALRTLLDEFTADPEATSAASQAYVRNYFPGVQSHAEANTSKASAMLKSAWPLYVCALDHYTAQGYAACACPSQK